MLIIYIYLNMGYVFFLSHCRVYVWYKNHHSTTNFCHLPEQVIPLFYIHNIFRNTIKLGFNPLDIFTSDIMVILFYILQFFI